MQALYRLLGPLPPSPGTPFLHHLHHTNTSSAKNQTSATAALISTPQGATSCQVESDLTGCSTKHLRGVRIVSEDSKCVNIDVCNCSIGRSKTSFHCQTYGTLLCTSPISDTNISTKTSSNASLTDTRSFTDNVVALFISGSSAASKTLSALTFVPSLSHGRQLLFAAGDAKDIASSKSSNSQGSKQYKGSNFYKAGCELEPSATRFITTNSRNELHVDSWFIDTLFLGTSTSACFQTKFLCENHRLLLRLPFDLISEKVLQIVKTKNEQLSQTSWDLFKKHLIRRADVGLQRQWAHVRSTLVLLSASNLSSTCAARIDPFCNARYQ